MADTLKFNGDTFELNDKGEPVFLLMTDKEWRSLHRDFKGIENGVKSALCMHPIRKSTTTIPVKIIKG